MRSKAYRGLAMEGSVARWYSANAQRERDESRMLARRIAERLPAAANVLEVAPGPGFLTIELAKLGNYTITGLDISKTFVRMARENAAREASEIDFRHGDVADMPFESECFDFIICQRALQNFSNPVRALQEMRRVLQTGGAAVVIDIRKDVSSRAINEHVKKVSPGVVNWLTNQLAFRLVLVRRAHTKDQLTELFTASGFQDFEFLEGPMFLEVWAHKRDC